MDVVNGQDAHADFDHISVNILKNDKLKAHKFHYSYPEEEDIQPIEQTSHHLGPSSRYLCIVLCVFRYFNIYLHIWLTMLKVIINILILNAFMSTYLRILHVVFNRIAAMAQLWWDFMVTRMHNSVLIYSIKTFFIGKILPDEDACILFSKFE